MKKLALLLTVAMLFGSVALAEDYRIVPEGETVELRIALKATGTNDDYIDNDFTRWIQEQSGVTLKIDTLPASDPKEKLNLMLASGDYPDIISGGNDLLSLAEQQVYADQGMLLPLNGLIDKYCVYFQQAIAKVPEVDFYRSFSLLDGQMYAFPNVVVCYHCYVSSRMWVYEPWLTALGLALPETTEEFAEMLKAFKEQDPNGNGLADEIPLAGSTNGWNTNPRNFLMNAFVQTGTNNDLYLVDGAVNVPYNKDEWKAGLEYIHGLYTEGLIAPETFTQNNDQLTLLVESETPIVGAVPGGVPPGQIDAGGRWLEFAGVPALEGPSGFRSTAFTPNAGYENRVHLTDNLKSDEKKLETAVKFVDLLYNDYVFLRANFGVEDVDWRFATEDELGYTGEHPGYIKFLGANETPDEMNHCWYQSIPEIQPLSFRFGRVMDSPLEKILYEVSNRCMYPYAPDQMTEVLPPMVYPSEDAAEVSDIQVALTEYVAEMFARFVTGDADIATGWDGYVRELEAIGLTRYLELQQKAYDIKIGK